MKFFKKKSTNTVAPPTPVVGTAGSLREFVYLDEVSVYSLTSAPDMPPPVSMSESASSTSGESLSGGIEGGAPLVGKASINSELNSSRTADLQVQRQFNIQSQFARLHGMYRPTFLLTVGGHDTKGKEATSLSDALVQLKKDQLAIPASELARGALAELRVSLRAHHTFDVSTFMRAVTGLAKRYPELLQIRDTTGFQTAMEAGEFLGELLEDLVPIEGQSTTHGIVADENGIVWIANMAALKTLWGTQVVAGPLRVVGVAETGSFWKDTRRILHAEAEFDVLGRVSRTGLQAEWTPVKMIDTFKRVVPSAAKGLIDAVDSLKYISNAVPASTAQANSVLLTAGESLNLKLAKNHGVAPLGLSPQFLAELVDDGSLEGQLAALRQVADSFYASHEGLERDEDQIGLLRQEAWQAAQSLATPTKLSIPNSEDEPDTPVLELEFIAMYW